ncbi:MAG TPA: hypothetical protein VGI14_06940 [Casimicrobiaceae bacterium]
MAQVKGFSPAISGQQPRDPSANPVPVGVWGDSNIGGGVFGTSGVLPPGSTIPIDPPAGVEGHGVDGPGVVGRSINDSGVVGEGLGSPGMLARSVNSSGLLGVTFSADDGSHGVFGSSTTGGNGVTGFVGSATGAIGSSVRGIGVHGTTGTGDAGVLGETFGDGSGSGAGPAVHGRSDEGVGVSGVSGSTDATRGLTFGNGYGHSSLHFSAQPGGGVLGVSVLGNGVEGFTFASLRDNPDVAAVRGQSANGFAGLFVGSVRVTGFLQKAGGGFTVDHPIDPKNKYLSHSFVESPEMLNVYSGTVTTGRDGIARVRLPAYFEALNRDFRYQLTVIGAFARAMVAEEIKDNAFVIRTDPGRVKVCWQVTGVRKDAWAEANRIAVEEAKPKTERGRYLHPELFGKGARAAHSMPATRVSDALPEKMRGRAEKTLSDLAGGRALGKDLRAVLDQARGSFGEQAAAGRARLRDDWNDVQERLKAMPAMRLQSRKQKR